MIGEMGIFIFGASVCPISNRITRIGVFFRMQQPKFRAMYAKFS